MSDTIVLYENGKAVGGEGHPTNADEITFDNENTDLVSEEVESAIKEVNAKFDRGSVSVTADGTKTNGQLLNELFALVDLAKVNSMSTFAVIANNSHTNYLLFHVTNTEARFSYTRASASNITTHTYNISANSSVLNSAITTAPAVTITETTSSIPVNGTVLKIIY